jgi:hypothetical protein
MIPFVQIFPTRHRQTSRRNRRFGADRFDAGPIAEFNATRIRFRSRFRSSGRQNGRQLDQTTFLTLRILFESKGFIWWAGAESNCRHEDFQSSALPTELPAHCTSANQRKPFIATRPIPRLQAAHKNHANAQCPFMCRSNRPNHWRGRAAMRDSTKSITLASRLTPSSTSISCTPVGLVTFTSVR